MPLSEQIRLTMANLACEAQTGYDNFGLRISAIFVILFGSLLGAWFPVWATRQQDTGKTRIPKWTLFIAKYFGSGVILGTAFIHLLAPAHEALSSPCLTGVIIEYPWVEGICLIVIFALFFVELITMRYAKFGHEDDAPDTFCDHEHDQTDDQEHDIESAETGDATNTDDRKNDRNTPPSPSNPNHDQNRTIDIIRRSQTNESDSHRTGFAAQMTGLFILEFGVIFHSIFIGLTLAVAGAEFITLYIVLVFHQTFEGLALGSRLAGISWPVSKQFTPYLLGLGYAISTPSAMAIGLAARKSLNPGSPTTLIVNGVFDSISAGILIYTGLIELMAHEFMFDEEMRQAPWAKIMAAFGMMCASAGLMSILGRWV